MGDALKQAQAENQKAAGELTESMRRLNALVEARQRREREAKIAAAGKAVGGILAFVALAAAGVAVGGAVVYLIAGLLSAVYGIPQMGYWTACLAYGLLRISVVTLGITK